MIQILKYNETFIKIIAEKFICHELQDYFTFYVPGYKHMPAYKQGRWDGQIKLFNLKTHLIYFGLFHQILKFANQRDYEVSYSSDFADTPFSVSEATTFIKSLNLPFEVRDYQVNSFVHAVRSHRRLILSPTGSGKSLSIYLLYKYYNTKTLLIVPTTGLVHQMASDFKSYGYDQEIHTITSGKEKNSDCNLIISTWQSIYKMDKDWYSQFNLCIVDESHLAKGQSLTTIMTNLVSCKYKFGFTGTLDGTATNKMVLEGLFGQVYQTTTTDTLIKEGHLAELKIKCIVFKYSDEIRKMAKHLNYQQEIDYIVHNMSRNKFIKNLSLSLEGNTLILFQYVEKHGNVLYQLIKHATDRPVYFVHGGIDGEERNDLRQLVETQNNAIIIASVQVFSTGINIKSLKNIIFTSPSKSRVRTLQSIGRVLRKTEDKTNSVLYDLVDDLSWKSRKNYTLTHFIERLKIYNQEKFPFKTYNVELK